MFHTILIANRGEIACRVATTARRLGIKTVAVYSDADAQAKHVALADQAVHIGPAAAKDSYLVPERILAAAALTGAQAIHPGYGFLSENEDFAALCAKHGLTFIGPPPAAIAAMGLKSAAKALMEKAHVPLVPGYHGQDQDPALLQREADRIGYPVLIKASAGGGGKGMRVVEAAADFQAALESCRREARNAFGDDAVLLEKYLTRPRHVEVQVFADSFGECVYLFERDCSVQRRHQKVLEEAPAPGMTAERRRAMGEAAVAAAKAVGYVGAGTVEFIVEGEQFYFMEMNTRLQVEHPVTELITGLDLVEWQLRVAAGERLPLRQAQLAIEGHALEARLYAEAPEKGFLPSIGTLQHLAFPEHRAFVLERELPRVDSGVRQGDAITPHYDPMIAKLIVWGKDRPAALERLAHLLSQTQVVGLSTNVAFLSRLIASAPFAQAELDTGLIARHHQALFPAPAAPSPVVLALAAAALLEAEAQAADHDPWSSRTGFRVNQVGLRTLRLASEAGPCPVTVRYERAGLQLTLGATGAAVPVTVVSQHHGELELRVGERAVRGRVVREGDRLHVFTGGAHHLLTLDDPFHHLAEDEGKGGLLAPMPGKIITHAATPGAPLKKGAPLLVMEAMKMEHTLTAPADGTVKAFLYRPGDQVAEGAALVDFQPA